jgi:hypothetical protein
MYWQCRNGKAFLSRLHFETKKPVGMQKRLPKKNPNEISESQKLGHSKILKSRHEKIIKAWRKIKVNAKESFDGIIHGPFNMMQWDKFLITNFSSAESDLERAEAEGEEAEVGWSRTWANCTKALNSSTWWEIALQRFPIFNPQTSNKLEILLKRRKAKIIICSWKKVN